VSATSENVLEQLIALGGDGVATFSLELRCTSWSARLASLFGAPPDVAIGRTLAELLANDHELAAARAARDGETVTAPPRLLVDSDGQRKLWQARFAPLRDGAGTVTGALALFRPVENGALEAEATNRIKDEFLATLSHELRTPLNAILGWSEYLLGGTDALSADDKRRGFETITRNARLQNRIVSDLLDASRIVTGKLILARKIVDLAQVIESAVESVRLSISAKRVTLDLTLDPSVGPVHGDADRLQQVVWNLLANAVRHVREQGRIEVALKRCGSVAEVQVRDDGEGIARELLPFVFNRFWQEDSGLRRRHGGLGLGLAIVRHLVEMHGGRVAVDSPGKGRGASFRFRLPLMAVRLPSLTGQEPAAPPRLVSTRLAGLRVLCIDDHEDLLSLVSRILLRAGAEVLTAQSVHDGLESLERRRPDVIACGLDLGHELSKRQLVVPALALSAHAHESLERAALDAGFCAYLLKPVSGAALVEQVAALAGRSGEETGP
jgi:signal transduction histidine kinase